mgnify:CR=1 FL=1
MKLVRDMIPAIIYEAGGSCEWRYCKDKQEYVELLIEKLNEEALELTEAENQDARIEEAGDLFEVLSALLKVYGVSLPQSEASAYKKRHRRGGFEAKIVLESFERP